MTAAVKPSADTVTQSIEYGLSRPPAAVGKRLRSEQELADLLHVGRWCVRESISHLVRNGILVRRRGSGTYVRKIPVMMDTGEDLPPSMRIPPDMLFAGEMPVRGTVLQPTARQQQLQLSLWTDWGMTTHATLQVLMASIVHRVQETGHHLSLHSLVERENVPLPVDVLSARLRESHYDGYLVLNRWSKQFSEAMKGVPGTVLTFHHSSQVLNQPALITLDTEAATQRALSLLAEEGYTRIGVLGYEDPSEPQGFKEGNYEVFMNRLGLPYRAVEFAARTPEAIWKATRKMFARADRPEAIYVAHDHALAVITDALRADQLEPGRDVGVITLSNRRGLALPHGFAWSCMEFDAERLGIAVVDELLRLIQSADAQPMAQSFHATWRPGNTHHCTIRSGKKAGSVNGDGLAEVSH